MHARVRGERREQRLVLDPLLRGRERRLVLDVAEREIAPDRGERVGVAALAVDRLDEHRRAVGDGSRRYGVASRPPSSMSVRSRTG